MTIENKNRLNTRSVKFSEELAPTIENLRNLELAPSIPERLRPLLDHLTYKVDKKISEIEKKGASFQIYGPDWCRENPQVAGTAHAEVIIKTYGETYALPNKNPKDNVKALDSGTHDMYLIFEDNKPVGTAVMVKQPNGWAELGRSASLGGVGNRIIQDLRIIRWLTTEDATQSVVGIFSTCRTAPDRNIGTEETPELMRGGQAVTHMWSVFPGVAVGGFGPLYKKHGALEQFAYAFVSKQESTIPANPFIYDSGDKKFVNNWTTYYQIREKINSVDKKLEKPSYSIHYPPLETKLTHLIHGEIVIEESGKVKSLDKAISKLNDVKTPFIQVQVPIDVDSRALQKELYSKGFQTFLFTPGIEDLQPPFLWFGKVTKGVPVISTFWQATKKENPFWNYDLSNYAADVANKW